MGICAPYFVLCILSVLDDCFVCVGGGRAKSSRRMMRYLPLDLLLIPCVQRQWIYSSYFLFAWMWLLGGIDAILAAWHERLNAVNALSKSPMLFSMLSMRGGLSATHRTHRTAFGPIVGGGRGYGSMPSKRAMRSARGGVIFTLIWWTSKK